MKASDILRNSAKHIEDRAAQRDQPQGERSMARCVAAFNALTGHQLSERDGWLFMVQLKMARACTTATGIPDDYEDAAAYSALAGESVAQPVANDNAGGFVILDGNGNVRVQIEGGELVVPPGYRWVAQDRGGNWWAYDVEPRKQSGYFVTGDGAKLNELSLFNGGRNDNWANTLTRVR